MTIRPSKVAIAKGRTIPFAPLGGTGPFEYSVTTGGAGGSISASGIYTAPDSLGTDEVNIYDTNEDVTVSASVMVGSPLELLCDILQTEMELADGRVYLWDQKINSPSDRGLWIAVAEINPKPFSNINRMNSSQEEEQSVNVHSMVSLDIVSRDRSALDRKEEVLMAVNSQYARNQQALNSFRIFPQSSRFMNLSEIDGGAIPYRFNVSLAIQYEVTKKKAVEYYDDFNDTQVETES
jgi:hypothetical protein